MMSYRSLLVIPLMILLGCKDYALKEPFKAPNGLYGYGEVLASRFQQRLA